MLGAIFGVFAGLESRRMKEAVLGVIGGRSLPLPTRTSRNI
jgi:hypothetical protein